MSTSSVVELRVSGSSDVPRLARTLAATLEHNLVEMRAIGAAATNQAIKAIARARQRALEEGWDIVVRPSFATISNATRPGTSGERDLSCIVMEVEMVKI